MLHEINSEDKVSGKRIMDSFLVLEIDIKKVEHGSGKVLDQSRIVFAKPSTILFIADKDQGLLGEIIRPKLYGAPN